MLGLISRALCTVAVATFASTALAVDYGRTPGTFSVSPTGAATYAIPIWTPPGPNGLQPSISMNYHSQVDNGIGGVGWNLGAVTSIERCPRTKHQDGSAAAISLLASIDRFCLGGSRLRLASGSYGIGGSVYYTEIADYSRITAFNTMGQGPQYFVVESKSGMKFEYGRTTDSQVVLAGTVLRWMLNKVYDRSGNNYIVSYNNADGFAVPDVISWTPTSLGALTYRHQAKFNYINTRTDIDSLQAKVAGFPLISRYRLENIQIKSVGTVIRKYRFTYDTSTVTSRSRLTSAKECADDAEANCLLPLAFSYQTGMVGLTPGSVSAPPGSSNSLKAGRYDFNGDGKDDIVYWSGTSWFVAFGANSGFSGPYNTNATIASILIDRFLPQGRAAIVAVVGGQLWSYRWDDASSAFVANNTGVSSTQPTTTIDYNGDGMADLLYYTSGATSIAVRPNTSTGSGNPSFNGSAFPTAPLASNQIYGGFQNPGLGGFHSDINGDGREDISVLIVFTGMGGGATYTTLLYGADAGFNVPPQAEWEAGSPPYGSTLNFNGDRCADRVINSNAIKVSACSGNATTGVTMPAPLGLLFDWDGDGKTDLLVNNGGTFGVYRSTGIGYTGLISTIIPWASGSVVDQDGDHLDDLIQSNGALPVNYWTHTPAGQVPATFATNIPDLLSNATDGFGVSTSPNYLSTAWGSYDKGAYTNYPLQEADPRIVVVQATNSDGIGGTYNRTYFYSGSRDHAERREFIGFQRVNETDSRNGIITRTYFEQTFPLSGMVGQQEVMQPNGVTTISRTVHANTFSTLDATFANQRYFRYPQASTTTQYEVGGTLNGNLVRTKIAGNTFDSISGALYDQTITTSEPASGANGVNPGGVWTARSYSPLANLVNDTANWCLGRPGRTQQINSHNLTYGSASSRTTDVTWNNALCRPTQTVDETGDADLQVTTDVGYDGFGNVNLITVTGIGMTGRTTSTLYSDATFTTGQFPLSLTNALNQTSTNTWNYDLGVPLSGTDPNGLTESWLYDAFGRKTRVNRSDGTAATWSINNCTAVAGGCVGAQNQTVVIATELTSIGGLINEIWSYLDKFDRPIVEKTRLLSGAYNRVNREFDALGRQYRESAPCFWSSCTTYWITNSYDLIDRPSAVSRPISDSIPTLQTTDVFYEGLTTRIRDPQLKFSYQISSAAGVLARSQDHDGYYQSFDFDAFGNPKRVLDQLGNALQTSTYNLRGVLTGRTDLDMGIWTFKPNALGEVVNIRDAKTSAPSWTQTLTYDLLGRLTGRTEAEGVSTWTWGTSSAAKNIGALASLSGPGYSESYTYTALAQPVSRVITAGGNSYQFNFAHNSQGKLDNITYPTSTSGYRLALKFDYQNGYLYRIRDLNALTTVFWIANASDARNQVTQETLNNGLVTNRSTDALTGRLKSIQTGMGGGTGVQSLAYEWDLAGNLKQRKDINQSNLTEDLFYDNLYRLDYSQRNGVTNLDVGYDALGNISSKSDVGTYTYHASKKHQVTSTSNGWSFGYDNNGNMTTGRGATMTWTSFNYPASITNGTDTSSFSYTPGRQYWQQVSNYTSGGAATTVYIGGLLEKVTTSAGTDFRHMIPAGGSTIIVSRKSSGTNTLNYLTSDHLGSSSAITNSSGGIVVNSSFDAFGKRRGSNWAGAPSAGDWSAIAGTTRRGYTGHSMLDNLNLVHMNGRIFDPVLGRALSSDPTIPSFNTQDFNRYSYVRNNPLSLSDPSGFAPGDFNSPDRIDGNDYVMSAQEELAWGRAGLGGQWMWAGSDSPRMGNFTGRGWFQQTRMQGFRDYNGPIKPEMSSNPSFGNADGSWRNYDVSYEMIEGELEDYEGSSSGTWQYRLASGAATREGMLGRFVWNNSGLKFFDCIFKIGTPCSGSEWLGGAASYAGVVILPIKGVGLVDDALRAGETIFKTVHYATRLEKVGVNVARAEAAVAKEVQAIRGSMNAGGDVAGRMRIDNVLVEYRARMLPDGSVNVGTIFPVGP